MTKSRKMDSPAKVLARAWLKTTLPTYLLDANGQLVFANGPLAELVGVAVEDLLGLDCQRAINADGAPSQQLASSLSLGTRADSCSAMLDTWRYLPPTHASLPGECLERTRLVVRIPHETAIFHLGLLWDDSQAESLVGLARTLEDSHSGGADLQRALVELRARYERWDGLTCLVGVSSESRRTLRQTEAAIASHQPVCLFGPEGVGKSEVAKAIYVARRKRQGLHELKYRLYPVECRLMDSSLLASVFEMLESPIARQGSESHQAIFLNRLDLLPKEVHPKLLEFLQSHRGEVFASTTAPSLTDIHPGERIWLDIVSLIDVHRIEMTPLQYRPQDVPVLMEAILQSLDKFELSGEASLRRLRFDPAVVHCLQGYGYPRNVTELKSIIESACEACRKENRDSIELRHLPVSVRTYASFVEAKQQTNASIDLDRLLEDVERTVIERTLERYPKNRALVARQLGISRARLLRRIEQWGLDPGGGRSEGSEADSIEFTEIDFRESEEGPAS